MARPVPGESNPTTLRHCAKVLSPGPPHIGTIDPGGRWRWLGVGSGLSCDLACRYVRVLPVHSVQPGRSDPANEGGDDVGAHYSLPAEPTYESAQLLEPGQRRKHPDSMYHAYEPEPGFPGDSGYSELAYVYRLADTQQYRPTLYAVPPNATMPDSEHALLPFVFRTAEPSPATPDPSPGGAACVISPGASESGYDEMHARTLSTPAYEALPFSARMLLVHEDGATSPRIKSVHRSNPLFGGAGATSR